MPRYTTGSSYKEKPVAEDAREQKYLEMISQFPESPLGYFTLGRYYVEVGRYREAIEPLERCLREEADWTAAMIALGDAWSGLGEKEKAIEVLEHALAAARAQNHPSLVQDVEERLEDLRD